MAVLFGPNPGSWATNADWVGGTRPTANDDVVFDATSGNCNVNDGGAPLLRSFDATDYQGVLSGSSTIIVVGQTTSSVVFSLGNSQHTYSGQLTPTPPSGATIDLTWGTKTLACSIYKNGAGVMNCKAPISISNIKTFTVNAGTVHFDDDTDTAGFTHTMGTFSSSNSNTRSFIFGNSKMNIIGSTGDLGMSNCTNATVSQGVNGSINLVGSAGGFNVAQSGTAPTFAGTVKFTGGGNMNAYGSWTVANFIVEGTSSKADQLSFAYNAAAVRVVTSALTLSGNSAVNRLYIKSSSTAGQRTPLTVSGATVIANGVDFRDIAFVSTSNVDLSGAENYTGDVGNNSISGGGALTFTPAVTSTLTGLNPTWSTGTWSSRVPLPQDTATVAATGLVTIDMKRCASNLSFTTPCSGSLSVGSSYGYFYKSVDLTNCTKISNNYLYLDMPTSGSFSITSGNCIVESAPNFISVVDNSTFVFNDTFVTTAGISNNNALPTSTLDFRNGATFATINGTQGIWKLGSGNFYFTGSLYDFSNVASFDAGTSNIYLTYNLNSTGTFTGRSAGMTLYNVYLYGNGATASMVWSFTSHLTFNKLEIAPGFQGVKTIRFTTAKNFTFTADSTGIGNGTYITTINCVTAGGTANFIKAGGGTIKWNYLSLKDNAATPASSFYYGNNSTVVSNVTGWTAGTGAVAFNGMWFGD